MILGLCAIGLCATTALAGCGTATLDSSKIAGLMRALLVDQAGLQVRSVDCPGHITEGTGIVTRCTATLKDGDTVKMTATQTANGIRVAPAEMIADRIEHFIVRALAGQGVSAAASCPQHEPIVVGERFDCTATERGGHSFTVHVTVIGASGAFRIR